MPEDRRLTISSSPHLAPDDVARHTFASVRRGFDPGEVRDYLESLAAGLRAQADHERELHQQIADAEDRAANPVLDEMTLTAAVGKETARVLQSAHEAASEVTANARAEADRLLAEATEAAEQVRTRADAHLAERTAEAETTTAQLKERTEVQVAKALEKARADAEALTERTREECRAMVEEAQQLRARVLADLSRRRRVLHAQIDQLRAGRERLAETIHDVRRSIDGIADDLFTAEDDAREAAEAAARAVSGRSEEGSPEEVAAALLAEEAAVGPTTEKPVGASAAGEAPAVEPGGASTPAGEGTASGEAVLSQAGEDLLPSARPVEQVDALFAKIRAHTEPAAGAGAGATEVDAPTGEPTDGGAVDGAGPPDARHPLAVRRDELIAPVVTALARRLKRELQDAQNELLDKLRAKGATWSEQMLPEEIEQRDACATAALPFLEQAAEAGAALVGGSATPTADDLVGVADQLADALVGPLRRRLTEGEGLADADEATVIEHVGSAFRQWKGERVERLAGDHVVAALSLGSIAAARAKGGSVLEWAPVAAAGETPCPDCEDNGLTGAQAPGEEFPTGHTHPPAHPGCRCLLAPVTP